MTEHKFTDEEIIKALKCISGAEEVFCRECAYVKIGGGFACKKLSAKDALDLINRQKAEIERLTVELDAMRGAANSYKMHYENAKSEVAREIFEEIAVAMCFAERQHRPFNSCDYVDYYDASLNIEIEELKKKYTEGKV